MKATTPRMVLAMAGMLVCLASIQAEELSYSELEARLFSLEARLAGQSGIQQATYCGGCCESGCGDACGGSGGCCDSCGGSCGCCGSGGCGDACGGSGGCCGCCGVGSDCCGSCGCSGGYYAAVDFTFMRAHILEGAGPGGKFAEEYELAPRFILGYENGCGQGLRLRYWHYGHDTRNLTNPNNAVRFQWDVVDLEMTNRFQFCRTDVLLAGGVRGAHLEITEDTTFDNDAIGLTMAADVETLMCCDCCSYWSWVYGGRISILGGDWERTAAGPTNDFFGGTTLIRDDNLVVTELYGGVEYGCCYCGYDLYTQLKLELQNWHSDALAQNGGLDSIGFIGPSWTVGLGF